MKKLLLFFLFPILCYSQQNFNFSTTNNVLIWEKIYESDLSKEEISEILKKDAVLNSVAENFTGNSMPVKMKCEETTPIYMRDQIEFFTSIDFKEGKYRVQVSNIQFIPSVTINLGGVETTETTTSLESYQLRSRDGELRKNSMAQNSLQCIDQYLQEKFNFKKSTKDW